MEKQTQERARAELITKYENRAFEALAMYSYWGQKYEPINKQLEDMEALIKKDENIITTIEQGPDAHSVENRKKITLLRKDIEDYEKRIEGVGTMAKKLFEKSVSWREEGVTLLEQVEMLKVFTLKTPEEMAAKQSEGVADQEIK